MAFKLHNFFGRRMAGGPRFTASRVISLAEVVRGEYRAIHSVDPPAADSAATENEKQKVVFEAIHRLGDDGQTALCLSGGGIRSATFNLGILQGLAKRNLLDKFDYLSTVSGGGYIGGWLTSWIHRTKSISDVQSSLKLVGPTVHGDEDKAVNACPIQWLREYSNFLTPRPGLVSADTWTLAATYLRNLILNWTLLIPILAMALLVPRIYFWLLSWRSVDVDSPHLASGWVMLSIGAILQTIALYKLSSATPDVRFVMPISQTRYLATRLSPLLAAALCATVGWSFLITNQGHWHSITDSLMLLGGFVIYSVTPAVLAAILVYEKVKYPSLRRVASLRLLTAAFGGALLCGMACQDWLNPTWHRMGYATLAIPTYLLCFLMESALYRAGMSLLTSDEDREWWARSSGWILISASVIAGANALILLAPAGLLWLTSWAQAAIAAAGGLSAVMVAALSHSWKTPGGPEGIAKTSGQRMRQLLLAFAAILFVLFLGALIALITSWLIGRFQSETRDLSWVPPQTTFPYEDFHDYKQRAVWRGRSEPTIPPAPGTAIIAVPDKHTAICLNTTWRQILLVAGICFLISGFGNRYVNINRFSLHAAYRDRIIRAYLGASNFQRHPDPFTGFDPADNFSMADLAGSGGCAQRPFHVINATLNLVAGQKLAWQQRKAASFTISALHCGSDDVGYRSSTEYGGGGERHISRPITLGAAVAISGAAADPNMGSYSSPVIGFLMTLLNVRAGAWLGNPGEAGQDTFALSSPILAAEPLLHELVGNTTESYEYVRLTDGGHFENLALYEMVRRRCRTIILCDAGQDSTFAYEDLGNAIRKIRIDLGISIDFVRPLSILPREPKPGGEARYCALAKIMYSSVDGSVEDGTLLYIKPAFYGRAEPVDVINYASLNDTFPHESTADQFFSESQFESYRALGEFVIDQLFENIDRSSHPDELSTLILGAMQHIKSLKSPKC